MICDQTCMLCLTLNRAPVYGDWIGWIADVGEPGQRWAWLGRLEFGEDEREPGEVTVRWRVVAWWAGRSRYRTRTGALERRRAEAGEGVGQMGFLGFGSCCVGGPRGGGWYPPGGLSAEVLDAPHGSRVARRTVFAIVAGNFEACFEVRFRRGAEVVAGGLRNQAAAQRQFLLAGTIGEKAVVADTDEASGQDMLQEATQELDRIEFHHPMAVATTLIVLVAEAHRVRVGSRDSAVGDGDAMGVAGEVLQDLLGTAEGWLGVHHPLRVA